MVVTAAYSAVAFPRCTPPSTSSTHPNLLNDHVMLFLTSRTSWCRDCRQIEARSSLVGPTSMIASCSRSRTTSSTPTPRQRAVRPTESANGYPQRCSIRFSNRLSTQDSHGFGGPAERVRLLVGSAAAVCARHRSSQEYIWTCFRRPNQGSE